MKPIVVDNLNYAYPTRVKKGGKASIQKVEEKETVWTLNHINFEVDKGKVLGIIGPNGAGKTTLALSLNGIVPHFYGGLFGGHVYIDSIDTTESNVSDLSTKVGLVFQNPEDQLSGMTSTLEEEVGFGLMVLGFPREEQMERVEKAIKAVGLRGLEKRNPFELSGGQQQRLAIATVLAIEPEIMVFDEPTAQLDPIGKFEVFGVLHSLAKSGKTIVIIEHEIEELATFSDDIMLLDEGCIKAWGNAKEVLNQVELLKEIGVNPPSVTELTYFVRSDLDLKIDALPITLEEAIKLYRDLVIAHA